MKFHNYTFLLLSLLVIYLKGNDAELVPECANYTPIQVTATFKEDVGEFTAIWFCVGLENEHPKYEREENDHLDKTAKYLFFSKEGVWTFADNILKETSKRAFWDSEKQPAVPPGSRFDESSESWVVTEGKKKKTDQLRLFPGRLVTCGSVLKLENEGSRGYRLFATNEMRFPDSKMGAVAAMPDYKGLEKESVGGHQVEKTATYWKIKEAYGDAKGMWETCGVGLQGKPITDGMVVRLEHVTSGKVMHVSSRQQWTTGISESPQVNLAGGVMDPKIGEFEPPYSGKSDANFMVQLSAHDRKKGYWMVSSSIHLVHHNTDRYLATNERNRYQPQSGELANRGEVTVAPVEKKPVPRMTWKVTDSVMFPSKLQLSE
mmetsp:Transcript_4057/g.4630  ORF Transcript_4057/g.4630 Transcript_4057/m.4630 type:complete len:375 (-) Transcript_4057:83-1207(-)|eukprot:CAMPEP_0197865814 /NCGR_PEP_ID=MMETSP1438-20131217/43875_1 /TAXON_ID=1461541 /ORGANISM="Pterosperma sp., Strain CCMP1384" /LENGTH=374 /DNA_ID=CAMNT_0043484325 /DNA_START=234 /DNA_END=1358 /DNA_ORIENTATION=+